MECNALSTYLIKEGKEGSHTRQASGDGRGGVPTFSSVLDKPEGGSIAYSTSVRSTLPLGRTS